MGNNEDYGLVFSETLESCKLFDAAGIIIQPYKRINSKQFNLIKLFLWSRNHKVLQIIRFKIGDIYSVFFLNFRSLKKLISLAEGYTFRQGKYNGQTDLHFPRNHQQNIVFPAKFQMNFCNYFGKNFFVPNLEKNSTIYFHSSHQSWNN
jgi:hypothetical protein